MSNVTPSKIPKIIHQIWNDREIPHQVYRKEWIDSWFHHHPDWLYVLWTGSMLRRFAEAHFPDYVRYVSSEVPPVVRADFGRLLVLLYWGGLYVDLDYICLKPVDPLIKDQRFVIPEVRPRCVTNSFIASVPGHPILKLALQKASSRMAELDSKPIQWLCGPQMMQAVVDEYEDSDFWLAPPNLLCPADWRKGYGLRRDISEEIVNSPARKWPEAYAVTFWAHYW